MNKNEPEKCLIISGGEFAPIDLSFTSFGLIIACDRGYAAAERMGIRPDIVIGDFDSYGGSIADIPVIRLPVMKDDTDTMSAVRYALDQDFSDITICCAFGGRFDHSVANLQTAAFIAGRGGKAAVLGTDTYAYAFSNDSMAFARRQGHTLSVFSLSDRCENVSESGVLYPLQNAVLTNRFPLGVSNSWTEDTARVSVGAGILLVIISKDN